ncbi:MAG: RICIN domain-containing protein, partial [Chitinophagales bacterium]
NAQAPQAGKTYYVQSALSSARYLASKSGGTASKTLIVIDQKTSRNKTALQWTLKNVGGGYYSFAHKKSNKGLDVKRTGTVRKTPLWLWPQHNGTAQKFKLQSAGGGYYYIIPKVNSRLRLDVQGARTTTGTPIWTFDHNGTNAQKWKFIEVPSTSTSSSGRRTGSHVEIPQSRFGGFASLIMDGIRMRMNNFGPRYRDRNNNVSWYKVDDSYFRLGNTTTRFNIPMYVNGVRDKTLYFNDMNLISTATTTTFEGNRLVVTLKVEENGTELKRMCPGCAKFREDRAAADAQISRHTWKIYLRLIPHNRSIAFEVTDVRFLGIASGFEPSVREVLIPAMKSQITAAFRSQRDYIAREIKRGTTAARYRFDNVRSVYVSGGNVGILTR